MNWNMQCNWQPNISMTALRLRAETIHKIRTFFNSRNVLEVETPLLGLSSATDTYLASFTTEFREATAAQTLYLQTSPEFPMKRLLAAGSGPIYQICKAFRNGEVSKRHNPEFTILEWYRPGFTHHQLMDEVDELLVTILQCDHADRISYAQLFRDFVGCNPHEVSNQELLDCLEKYQIAMSPTMDKDDRDLLLDLILTHLIEPHLGIEKPIFVFDYPVSQAALARIRVDTHPVGERFEVYFKGVELANGYHELSDANEQHRRFLVDNERRSNLGLPTLPLDEKFLSALHNSFPQCAGVALGLDRLIMLLLNTTNIADVITFTLDQL